MATSPSRAEMWEKEKRAEVNLAPGQYDDRSYQIGSDSKGFTIGEKREFKVEESLGPGQYDIEKG